MENRTIELLKQFISDKIKLRREDVANVYNSDEDQATQLAELRQIEMTARLQNSVFNYAKWYSANNEIIMLESILQKVKEMERIMGEKRSENENNRQR